MRRRQTATPVLASLLSTPPLLLLLGAPAAFGAGNPGVPPDPPPATRHNVSLGASLEATHRQLEVDGRGVDDAGGETSLANLFGLKLDYSFRPVTLVSLGARVSWSQWLSDYRIGGHYFDFGLEPRIWPMGLPPTDWYLGVPFGVSVPVVDAPPQRAYQTSIRTRSSWHLGGTLGFDFLVGRGPWRLYAEAGYLVHLTRQTVTLTPLVPEFAGESEDWRYRDGTVFVRTGGTLGLDPL